MFQYFHQRIMNNRNKLIDIFIKYNSQINLSAIRDPDWIYQKHILDSIELNNFFNFKIWSSIADIGTWGGFPLLPLSITHPECTFTGIDSIRKKVDTVNKMIQEIWIANAKAIWTRIEDYNGPQFDYVTARAVGIIDKIIDWSYELLKKSGFYILYKQYSIEEEKILHKICKQKNLKLIKKHSYTLFAGDIQRMIYILQKN